MNDKKLKTMNTLFILLALIFAVYANSADDKKELASIDIIKTLNNKDAEFAFILYGGYSQKKLFYPFNVSGNMVRIYFNLNMIELGIHKDGIKPFISKRKHKIIWLNDADKFFGRYYEWKANFATLHWFFSFYDSTFAISENVFLWKINDKNQKNIFLSKFDKKDSLNFKIAKLIGVNSPYAFAFIVSNNTSKDVELPGFYSESCCLKVKFPDGKEFIYQLAEAPKNIKLAPGESQFVKFDITELLKNSKKFTLDNFNYGVSELIWEVKLLDGTIEKRTFKLLKTEKPLPEMTKTGQGWQIPIDQPIK